ncbi:MAG: cupin domain-containing protein [Proteobacteria bacterium]|nr:cupin domain-containing protein [Pseudomonadota bacterium]
MDSRFVETHTMPWEETRYPGVEAKTLLVDRRTGLLTVLLKMAPGAILPDHEHVQIEQTFVIEGALVCSEGTCSAGNFVWRPAGSRHQAGTPNGGLMLAVFQLPNKFFEADGTATDMLAQDWKEFWGGATANEL